MSTTRVSTTPGFGSRPRVHAHRGDSKECPENTLLAFESAKRAGADAIEFDVHQTRDGVLVVHHDFDLRRTAGVDWYLHETDYRELATLDVGSWRSEQFSGLRIPTLEEVLSIDGVHFELEVKGLPSRTLVDSILETVKHFDRFDRTEFTSASAPTLSYLRERDGAARIGYFAEPAAAWMSSALYHDLTLATMELGHFDVLHVRFDTIAVFSDVLVAAAGTRIDLHAWGASSDVELEACAPLCDQLATDRPREAIALLQNR